MTGEEGRIASKEEIAEAGQGAGWLVPAVLVACTGVSILSTDLYLPSLPHLPELLGTDVPTVQLTLSLNLATFAVAQLLHGPLSDRIGRRLLLLCGLTGFFLSSLVCGLAGSVEVLIAGRIGQGLTASVGSVVILLIIRDLYQDAKAMQVLAAYGLAVGLVPAVGPLLGGYVFIFFGWQANFLLLAGAIVLVFLLVARYVPETGERDPRALRLGHMVLSYLSLLTNRGYLRYFIPLSCSFGALFAFLTEGPFLLIERLGVPTEHYGLYQAVIVVAYMAGSLLVARLARTVKATTFVRLALFLGSLGTGFLFVMAALGPVDLATVMASSAIYGVSLGFILASGPLCLLEAVSHGPKGPASALLGATQMGMGSVASLLTAFMHDGTAWPMSATMFGLFVVGLLGYLVFAPPRGPST